MKTIALLLLGCLAVASSYRVTLEEDVPVHDGKTSSWVRGVKPNPSHELTLTVAMRVEAGTLLCSAKYCMVVFAKTSNRSSLWQSFRERWIHRDLPCAHNLEKALSW